MGASCHFCPFAVKIEYWGIIACLHDPVLWETFAKFYAEMIQRHYDIIYDVITFLTVNFYEKWHAKANLIPSPSPLFMMKRCEICSKIIIRDENQPAILFHSLQDKHQEKQIDIPLIDDRFNQFTILLNGWKITKCRN